MSVSSCQPCDLCGKWLSAKLQFTVTPDLAEKLFKYYGATASNKVCNNCRLQRTAVDVVQKHTTGLLDFVCLNLIFVLFSGVAPMSVETKKERVDAVVLFLAHDGVYHPDVWQAWRSPRVGFLVHANPEIDAKDAFAKAHGIPVAKRIFPTKWGEASTVLAWQVVLREALTLFPDAQMFYFVSGSDIPIRPASFLLELVPFSRMAGLDPEDWKSPHLPHGWQQSDFVHHVEWIALTRTHAALIADFDFTPLLKVDALLASASARKSADPAEYFIGTALRVSLRLRSLPWNVDSGSHLTVALRSNANDPSPILWQSLSDTRQVWMGPKDTDHKSLSFREAIDMALASEDEPNHLFFRKVGRFDLKGVFDWCQ